MSNSPELSKQTDPYFFGFLSSTLIHSLLIVWAVIVAAGAPVKFKKPIVYSVTIEGGKRLGGIAQVPKKDKDTKSVAPPKNVKKVEKKKETIKKKETSKVVVKKKKVDPKKKVEKKPEQKKVAAKKPEKVEKKPPVKKKTTQSKKESAGDIDKKLQAAMQRYLGESSKAGGTGFGAAALGGKGMGGGVVRPPAFFHYMKLLENHVKSKWRWYDSSAQLECAVLFRIARDGRVSAIEVQGSSGNREFDRSALRAVEKANPVPPPPESVYKYFEQVRISFNPADG